MNLFARRKTTLISLLSLLLLAAGLAACGNVNAPDKLILNEVYTTPGEQWVELYNNSGAPLSLAGWRLETAHGSIDLGASDPTSLPAKGYLVVTGTQAQYTQFKSDFGLTKSPAAIKYTDGTIIGSGLHTEGDIIVLSNTATPAAATPSSSAATPGATTAPGGPTIINGNAAPTGPQAIDDVSWGTKPSGPDYDAFFKQFSTVGWQGGSAPNKYQSLGRTPEGLESDRTPDNPGPWNLHASPSPGGPVVAPGEKYNLFLNVITNILTAIGGLLLWLAFVMIGLIARRFQTLSQQRTYWYLLMAAPIGIAFYLIVTVLGYLSGSALNSGQKWTGFFALFVAGIACLLIVSIFRRISRSILEAE